MATPNTIRSDQPLSFQDRAFFPLTLVAHPEVDPFDMWTNQWFSVQERKEALELDLRRQRYAEPSPTNSDSWKTKITQWERWDAIQTRMEQRIHEHCKPAIHPHAAEVIASLMYYGTEKEQRQRMMRYVAGGGDPQYLLENLFEHPKVSLWHKELLQNIPHASWATKIKHYTEHQALRAFYAHPDEVHSDAIQYIFTLNKPEQQKFFASLLSPQITHFEMYRWDALWDTLVQLKIHPIGALAYVVATHKTMPINDQFAAMAMCYPQEMQALIQLHQRDARWLREPYRYTYKHQPPPIDPLDWLEFESRSEDPKMYLQPLFSEQTHTPPLCVESTMDLTSAMTDI